MKISVIGCGYLGAVHAAAMAGLGHEVVGIDVDARKIERLDAAARGEGTPPFFEPGLGEALVAAHATGRLRFCTDPAAASGSRVHFITVGTPQRQGAYSADLSFVRSAVDGLIPHLDAGDLVVGKSTVPVGTAAELAGQLAAAAPSVSLAWNPEFLREGHAVDDTLHPDRLVYGVGRSTDGALDQHAVDTLDEVYASAVAADTPRVVTDYATAELVKVAANAFLATKISFINAMAEIAEVTGADVTQLADALGHDERIGRRFLNAGVGFGGGCLPKDIRAFTARAEELGRAESVAFLKEVDQVNLRRRRRVVELVLAELSGAPDDDGGVPDGAAEASAANGAAVAGVDGATEAAPYVGKKVAILGLAFKPHSDDVRDSPALDVAVQLRGLGVHVVATDPQAIENARGMHPQLDYTDDIDEALRDADAVVLLTEWPQFREFEPSRAAALVQSATIVDARNVLDSAAWRAAGWSYRGLGR